jgi:hypothetical protein
VAPGKLLLSNQESSATGWKKPVRLRRTPSPGIGSETVRLSERPPLCQMFGPMCGPTECRSARSDKPPPPHDADSPANSLYEFSNADIDRLNAGLLS